MMELKKTSIVLRKTIRELEKASKIHDAPIWAKIAEELAKPTRRRRAVNLSRLNRYTVEGDVVVVPGKVLGSGRIDHKTAYEQLLKAGCRVLSLTELVRENPKGSNVKIIG
jgi:large subunit ribosomal protein L18e